MPRTVEQMDRERIPMSERTKEEALATMRAAVAEVKNGMEAPHVAAAIREVLTPSET